MNLLTINNKEFLGYDAYYFLNHYKNIGDYEINLNKEGYLFLYEQYFPFEVLSLITNNYSLNNNLFYSFLEKRIKFMYLSSRNLLDKIIKIYFFYPFTYYDKNSYSFDILNFLKQEIEKKFKKECLFILNNFKTNNEYINFNAMRYDIFNTAINIKKNKNNKKEKIFISLNAKIKKHRDDLHEFFIKENLLKNTFFSYVQKKIYFTNIIKDFDMFFEDYKNNKEKSSHLIFENYLNDDLYSTQNSHFFDKSYYYIITETSCSDDVCYISEKTYKSFYHQIPFLILGNPYTIKELKKNGFKTFNKWIDESYDEETNYEKRKNKLFLEIKRLNSLSQKEHDRINIEMQNIFEFNYNHLFDFSNFKKDFIEKI